MVRYVVVVLLVVLLQLAAVVLCDSVIECDSTTQQCDDTTTNQAIASSTQSTLHSAEYKAFIDSIQIPIVHIPALSYALQVIHIKGSGLVLEFGV